MSNFINFYNNGNFNNSNISTIFNSITSNFSENNVNVYSNYIRNKIKLYFDITNNKLLFNAFSEIGIYTLCDYIFYKPQTITSHIFETLINNSDSINIFEKAFTPNNYNELSVNYNSGIGNFTLHFKSNDNSYYYKVSGTYEFEHNGTSFTNKNVVINSVFESATSSGVNLDTSTGILTFSNTGNIKIVFSNHCAV